MTIAENNIPQESTTADQPLLAITEVAADRLLKMMEEKDLQDYSLRVFVAGGGCSGLQYGMTFDDETREGDSVFTTHNLRVLVDPMSATYLAGANVDFVDTLMGGGFKIDNPNAVSSCGCGHSFRTDEAEGGEGEAASGCGSCSSY